MRVVTARVAGGESSSWLAQAVKPPHRTTIVTPISKARTNIFNMFETSREILTRSAPEISDPRVPPTHSESDGHVTDPSVFVRHHFNAYRTASLPRHIIHRPNGSRQGSYGFAGALPFAVPVWRTSPLDVSAGGLTPVSALIGRRDTSLRRLFSTAEA